MFIIKIYLMVGMIMLWLYTLTCMLAYIGVYLYLKYVERGAFFNGTDVEEERKEFEEILYKYIGKHWATLRAIVKTWLSLVFLWPLNIIVTIKYFIHKFDKRA